MLTRKHWLSLRMGEGRCGGLRTTSLLPYHSPSEGADSPPVDRDGGNACPLYALHQVQGFFQLRQKTTSVFTKGIQGQLLTPQWTQLQPLLQTNAAPQQPLPAPNSASPNRTGLQSCTATLPMAGYGSCRSQVCVSL